MPGAGGAGGGGLGGTYGYPPTAGAANTGGGGGGESGYYNGSVAGGSGIVIVRYPGAVRANGGTITSAGGYSIHTFTSNGTFTLGQKTGNDLNVLHVTNPPPAASRHKCDNDDGDVWSSRKLPGNCDQQPDELRVRVGSQCSRHDQLQHSNRPIYDHTNCGRDV